MIFKENINEYKNILKENSPEEIVQWIYTNFDTQKVAFASSLSPEDQVLTDIIIKINPKAVIFTLDTGRLPVETYNLIQETNKKYNINIKIVFPEKEKVESMVNSYGPNLFYDSLENRKLCCKIRKVDPLRNELKKYDAWITGLRKKQSVTRTGLEAIEFDDTNNLFKISPLFNWDEEKIWNYIKFNNIAINELYNKGYPSIGCAPCTRAIKPGEDVRAGRWWWEDPEHKECGLHVKESES